MRFTVITIFPEMFGAFLDTGVLGRARLARANLPGGRYSGSADIDPRDWFLLQFA
jgi:tRNA G37 N-methylase TrmD